MKSQDGIVEDIWGSLIHLQSIFSPIGNQGKNNMEKIYIDETYASLRCLFSRYKDYEDLNEQIGFFTSSPERFKQEKLERYFVALQRFWQQTRINIPVSPDLLLETRQTLQAIIQQHKEALTIFSVPLSYSGINSGKNDPSLLYKTPVRRTRNDLQKTPLPIRMRAISPLNDRQKTEPRLNINKVSQNGFIKHNDLILKKSQDTNQFLLEENLNLMRQNQQFQSNLLSQHEQIQLKSIQAQHLETQLFQFKHDLVIYFHENQMREKTRSFQLLKPKDLSPNQFQAHQNQISQVNKNKIKLTHEANNIQQIIKSQQQNKQVTAKDQSESELKYIISQQKFLIDDLKQKIILKKDDQSNNIQINVGDDQTLEIKNLQIQIIKLTNLINLQQQEIQLSEQKYIGLADFIKEKLTANHNYLQQINDLQNDNEKFQQQIQMRGQDFSEQKRIKDANELKMNLLLEENQHLLDDNKRLSIKISELYVEMNESNQNDDDKSIRHLQLQNQVLQEQILKGNDERKRLNLQIDKHQQDLVERDLIIQTLEQEKQFSNEENQRSQLIHNNEDQIQSQVIAVEAPKKQKIQLNQQNQNYNDESGSHVEPIEIQNQDTSNEPRIEYQNQSEQKSSHDNNDQLVMHDQQEQFIDESKYQYQDQEYKVPQPENFQENNDYESVQDKTLQLGVLKRWDYQMKL